MGWRTQPTLVAVLSLVLPSLQYTLRYPVGRPRLIRAAITAEAEVAEIDLPRLTQEDGALRREEIARLKAAQGPEAAAMWLQEHLEENPGDVDALIELGNVWSALGLGMTAAECYARAIGLAPESAEAYECMGTLLASELFEDHEQAEAALRQAVALDGARHGAWFELANLLKRAESREYEGALAALRSARALAPTEGAYCPPLVYVCTAAGRFGGARRALRDAC